MSTTADLPDLNVWLALVWPEHSHHQHAVHYWEVQASDRVLFSTVTALGLVRLVSQPKLMGPAVSNAAEASALLEALCQQPGVGLAEPLLHVAAQQALEGDTLISRPGFQPCE